MMQISQSLSPNCGVRCRVIEDSSWDRVQDIYILYISTYIFTVSRIQHDHLSNLIFLHTKKEQDKQGVQRLFGAPHVTVSCIRNPLLLSYPNTLGNKDSLGYADAPKQFRPIVNLKREKV